MTHTSSLVENCSKESLGQLSLLGVKGLGKGQDGSRESGVPSGYVKIAIENGHVIECSLEKKGDSP